MSSFQHFQAFENKLLLLTYGTFSPLFLIPTCSQSDTSRTILCTYINVHTDYSSGF